MVLRELRKWLELTANCVRVRHGRRGQRSVELVVM